MKQVLPEKLNLAHKPTAIQKLKISSRYQHIDVYIKREDQTGFELSGNKVRKLEYLLKDVVDKGYNHVITCGALQSNHVRTTAAAAAQLGLKCTALLKGEPESPAWNYYMTGKFGADIHYIDEESYKNHRNDRMADLKNQAEEKGHRVYIIPEGASNGLGNLGYFSVFEEILSQEAQLGMEFNLLSLPVGSCGTYAGLYMANDYYNKKKHILGINIYDDAVDFNQKTKSLIEESKDYSRAAIGISYAGLDIRNKYVGQGYGKTSNAVYAFMDKFARTEGILLDPVYTGKAFYGFIQELDKLDNQVTSPMNVLFIHTGGSFLQR